jgi:hypothetical protein
MKNDSPILFSCHPLTSRLRKIFAILTFKPLEAALVKNAILDGELIGLDAQGRWLNDQDLRALPLIERKNDVRKLIPPFVICQQESELHAGERP